MPTFVDEISQGDASECGLAALSKWSAAAIAAALPGFFSMGASRATGLPRRVITISSPISTLLRRPPKVFLASNAPTSAIPPPFI